MKASEDWKFQVSLKIDSHLLNVRADDIAELMSALRDIQSNAPEIMATAGAFHPPSPPAAAPRPPVAPQATQTQPQAPSAPSSEIGPVTVEKVDVSEGMGKNGKPYQRYVIVVGGVKCATFDTLLGNAAKSLLGKQCFFSAEKGNYGYDLKSIRAA